MVFVSRRTFAFAGRMLASMPASPAVMCTHALALPSGGSGVSLSTGA